jgi:excisionase family DNA binding protein
MNDTINRAKEIIEQSARAERAAAPRRRTRRRRKTYAKIEDLATHPEPNLALQQLAAYWNVEVQTLRKWIREQALVAFHVGRSPRVKRADALAFEQASQLRKAAS